MKFKIGEEVSLNEEGKKIFPHLVDVVMIICNIRVHPNHTLYDVNIVPNNTSWPSYVVYESELKDNSFFKDQDYDYV